MKRANGNRNGHSHDLEHPERSARRILQELINPSEGVERLLFQCPTAQLVSDLQPVPGNQRTERGFVEPPGGDAFEAYLKPLEQEDFWREVLSANIAPLFGVLVPEFFEVTNVETDSGDVVFASRAVNSIFPFARSRGRVEESDKTTARMLPMWFAFDEFIRNVDRQAADVISTPDQHHYLIDHDFAFKPPHDSRVVAERSYFGDCLVGRSEDERKALIQSIHKRINDAVRVLEHSTKSYTQPLDAGAAPLLTFIAERSSVYPMILRVAMRLVGDEDGSDTLF